MTDEGIAREACSRLTHRYYEVNGETISADLPIILDAIKRAKSEDKERLDWLSEVCYLP